MSRPASSSLAAGRTVAASVAPASPSGARAASPPSSASDWSDEVSAPFFKGLGVVFVDVEGQDEAGAEAMRCDLCVFARKHPPPPRDEADPTLGAEHDHHWGVLHHVLDGVTLCKQEQEEEQHAFHLGCLRAFVLAKKAHFRNKPGCPVCDNTILDKSKAKGNAAAPRQGQDAADDDDDDAFGDDDGELEDVGQTGGKARKRVRQMYSVWVHVRQATGLKLVKSDKTMNPVAYVSCFGKTIATERGDGGKTYNCVWNESFSYQKLLDEDELTRETLQIRIEDHKSLWSNTLIGFVKFELAHVHAQPNHEFYQLAYPIVNMASKKQQRAVTMQGQLEVSVCVLSEADMKQNPELPIHIYDLEVEMFAELLDKQEVVDFDINKRYLQNNLDKHAADTAAAALTHWDIVHVKVYRAEDLPKLDTFGSGWVDAFIELEYKGLLDKGAKLKSKPVLKSASPVWNVEFTVPVVHGAPLVYNSFELVVKNHNTLAQNEWIGKCALNISDILALPDNSPPMWKSLYQDLDGRAPTYRGRVLIQVSVERRQKDAKLFANPCANCREDLIPPSGSYRLDFELLEGVHLLESFKDYQVDVTLGHTMTAASERDKGGKCWQTFVSDSKLLKGPNKTVVPFLTKKSIIVHNLPYPRRVDSPKAEDEDRDTEKGGKKKPLSASGTVAPTLDATTGTAAGFTGDPSQLTFNSVAENFSKNTTLLDYKSMMPDLIVYVSKRGTENVQKNCIGYLRVPLNGLKRPTENWEHGEDLTPFPLLWEPNQASARCLPLKPLVELYQLTCGFLLFKATLTPVSGGAALAAGQVVESKLAAVPRQRYKMVVNVLQAKDMASVDPSGLSSPFATVQIGDLVLKTKPKMHTCFPLWFEALSDTVELPVNLQYAPDFAVTCYHHKDSVFKFRDPSIFMGRADVPATAASTGLDNGEAAWYPLQFEEQHYGHILLSFRLTPQKDLPTGGLDVVQHGLDRMVDGWESYAVEVSALDIRGKMAKRHQLKKIDPVYQIECWGEYQTYKASDIAGDKFTVFLRKPSNPVFYSSINFRIYEGKDMAGVTSIPLNSILRSGASWYKLMELILRDEKFVWKRVVRQWRKFVERKRYVDPRTIRQKPKQVAFVDTQLQSYQQDGELASPSAVDLTDDTTRDTALPASAAASSNGSRFAYLSASSSPPAPSKAPTEKTALTHSLASSSSYATSQDALAITVDQAKADEAARAQQELLQAAAKPRQVDADGNEVFDEAVVQDMQYLQCDKLPDRDAGNPFELHWRIGCEYENLPLVNDPFITVDVFVGKDEIHSTFLDRLFARSKHSVGSLRAHFYAYRIGKIPRPEEQKERQALARVNPLFESDKYFNPAEYCVRVYILRGLQLSVSKGKAANCDPFVSVSMQGGEAKKSEVLDGTLNPAFYSVFDFERVKFPALDTTLSIAMFNDNTLLTSELIGSTEITLENRLFSKPWNKGQKPIERRALRRSKTGRLAQGFVECVVQILPQSEAGNRALDYLLDPPRRIPWELRVTLFNCRKVTMKKIYKQEDDCCCYDCLAPPNQSDIKLVAGMTGSKQLPQSTDTHPRSIDGDGMFNWRCIFDVELPAPKMLCNLKLQVWNINWSPDDCLAEAVIPLHGFFELARRQLDADRDNPDKWLRTIPRQWVKLRHPQNSDQGEVEVEVELLPKEVAQKSSYRAAPGEKAFLPEENAPHYVLQPPNRPDDSFEWYRIDKQIMWRLKYAWKKSRGCILLCLLIFVGIIVLFGFLRRQIGL